MLFLSYIDNLKTDLLDLLDGTLTDATTPGQSISVKAIFLSGLLMRFISM